MHSFLANHNQTNSRLECLWICSRTLFMQLDDSRPFFHCDFCVIFENHIPKPYAHWFCRCAYGTLSPSSANHARQLNASLPWPKPLFHPIKFVPLFILFRMKTNWDCSCSAALARRSLAHFSFVLIVYLWPQQLKFTTKCKREIYTHPPRILSLLLCARVCVFCTVLSVACGYRFCLIW